MERYTDCIKTSLHMTSVDSRYLQICRDLPIISQVVEELGLPEPGRQDHLQVQFPAIIEHDVVVLRDAAGCGAQVGPLFDRRAVAVFVLHKPAGLCRTVNLGETVAIA